MRAIFGRARALLPRRFAKDVGALTLANIVVGVVGLAQGLVVARWLGPQGYGLAALIMSYPGFVLSIVSFRTGQGAVKYMGEFAAVGRRDQLLALCRFSYALNLAVALLTLVIVAVTARWVEGSLLKTAGTGGLLILFTAAYVPASFAEASVAVFSTLGRFRTLAWIRAGTTLFRLGAVVLLLWAGYGAAGVVGAAAMTMGLRGILLLVASHRAVLIRWGGSWLRAPWDGLAGKWREVLGFFLYTNLTALVGVAVKQLDVLALGYFQGPAMAGNYSLAKVFGTAIGSFGRTLQTVIYPRFAALWGAGRVDEFRDVLRRAAIGLGLPLGAGFLLGLPLLPILVPLVVGSRFADAVPIIAVAYVMTAMSLALFWLRPWFLSTGRVRTWFGLSAANSLFALIAFPIGAAVGSGLGVALARLAGRIIRNASAVVIVVRAGRAPGGDQDLTPARVPVPGGPPDASSSR
ncbi:MAG TPA: lipopolysaccharide biosynthesis protein [bacterium]|jgi:O-antigen/teichoic acid export membrane protein|nr:lipopolysaccharide biosynthesis protein [bacterium]